MNDETNPPSPSGTSLRQAPGNATIHKWAIASLVIGVTSLVLCPGGLLGLVAIFLGVAARKAISQDADRWKGAQFALGGIVTGGIGVILGLSIIGLYFWQKNAEMKISKLGEAQKILFAQPGGEVAFGNTDKGQAVAASVASRMEEFAASFAEKPSGISIEGDKFLVYCWLAKDSAAFLVTVPNLRKYSDEGKGAMIETAWTIAQKAVKDGGLGDGLRLAVATRGALAYDQILIGKQTSSAHEAKVSLEKDLERCFH